ncbi:hypothetical protein MBLNU459_g0679t4 [Dothideomycetes sp. NU459]
MQSPPNLADETLNKGSGIASSIRFYIARNNGTHVPLIPADELPHNVRLQGVPRTITAEEARFHKMEYSGMRPLTKSTLVLESPLRLTGATCQPTSTGHTQPYLAPDVCAKAGAYNGQIAVFAGAAPQKNSETQATIDRIASTKTAASISAAYPLKPRLPPSGIEPDETKKTYCTYWIRTGECDYMEKGCRFKHEMPNQETLASIGFARGTPSWWLKKRFQQAWRKRQPLVLPNRKGDFTGGRVLTDSEAEESDSRPAQRYKHATVSTPTSNAATTNAAANATATNSLDQSRHSAQEARVPSNTSELRPSTAATATTSAAAAESTDDLIDLGVPDTRPISPSSVTRPISPISATSSIISPASTTSNSSSSLSSAAAPTATVPGPGAVGTSGCKPDDADHRLANRTARKQEKRDKRRTGQGLVRDGGDANRQQRGAAKAHLAKRSAGYGNAYGYGKGDHRGGKAIVEAVCDALS